MYKWSQRKKKKKWNPNRSELKDFIGKFLSRSILIIDVTVAIANATDRRRKKSQQQQERRKRVYVSFLWYFRVVCLPLLCIDTTIDREDEKCSRAFLPRTGIRASTESSHKSIETAVAAAAGFLSARDSGLMIFCENRVHVKLTANMPIKEITRGEKTVNNLYIFS